MLDNNGVTLFLHYNEKVLQPLSAPTAAVLCTVGVKYS